MSREDPGRPRSVTLLLRKKLKRPQHLGRNTPERCEDGEATSPVVLLRIVRAVVIWVTDSTLLLICQGAAGDFGCPRSSAGPWLGESSRRHAAADYPDPTRRTLTCQPNFAVLDAHRRVEHGSSALDLELPAVPGAGEHPNFSAVAVLVRFGKKVGARDMAVTTRR